MGIVLTNALLVDIDPLVPTTSVTLTIQDVHDEGGALMNPNPLSTRNVLIVPVIVYLNSGLSQPGFSAPRPSLG